MFHLIYCVIYPSLHHAITTENLYGDKSNIKTITINFIFPGLSRDTARKSCDVVALKLGYKL